MRYLFLVLLSSIFAFSTGCTNTSTLAGDVYTVGQAKTGLKVQYGVITNIRTVSIQAKDSGVGGLAGAAIGGIGGANTTDSKAESQIFGVIAGFLGGLIGKKVEDKVNKVASLEIDVKLASGEIFAVVQKQGSATFLKGQKVRVIGSGPHMHIAPIL